MYGSWDMECDGQIFFVILDHFFSSFCPFTPLITLKIKIFKKLKKAPGDIIILQTHNINDNHIIYSS